MNTSNSDCSISSTSKNKYQGLHLVQCRLAVLVKEEL